MAYIQNDTIKYFTKEELQKSFETNINGSGSTGDEDLDYALYNWVERGVQSTEEAFLIANWMLDRYHGVDGDIQIKYLNDIFYSLLPYCEKRNDYTAVWRINTKLLKTFQK